MIRLSETQKRAIGAHGAEAFPRECVGVLLGDVENDVKIVREVRRFANTFAPDADFERSILDGAEQQTAEVSEVGQERRYLVAPDDMFRLMQEERRTKVKVLGFYHSHPNHPARPSEYDRVWASPWYSYLIVSVQNGVPADLTAWVLRDDQDAFSEEHIETV